MQIAYCEVRQCLQPVYRDLLDTMITDPTVSQSAALFKASQLYIQKYMKISRPAATDVDWLRGGHI